MLVQLNIRLPRADRTLLAARAAVAGCSLADYVLMMILPDREHDTLNSAELDRVYNRMDTGLRARRFAEIDEELDRTNPTDIHNTDYLLALLTLTLPAKSKLANRPAFFDRCKKTFEDRGHEIAVWGGLE